ncbi:MAG: hypothetical protein K0Q92_2348 [Steroidobacteraceae bacterium]|nr:hypothetical protein [Steroidobacteraceae bacterium]
MKLLRECWLIAAIAISTTCLSAEPPLASPLIPADIKAMLLEHRGQWRTEGWQIEGDKRTPVKASWECKPAVNGVGNVCTWYHEWADRPHDSALDIMGYDPKLKVLRIQRVNDTGILGAGAEVTVRGNTMTVVRESTSEAGKPRVMRNEIVVVKPGEWQQHISFDEDGKRVREWRMTQRRVNTPVPVGQTAVQPAEVPAEIASWLEGQRGKWRSEGVIVKGEERTQAFANWECAAAVNGVGNVCTWHHEWTNRPEDWAMDIAGYDPRSKLMTIARLSDTGLLDEPVSVAVRGNTLSAERHLVENGKPAVMRNEIVVTSRDERKQRMSVEVDGKAVREFIITHRRVD